MHLLNLEHDCCGDKFWKTQLATFEIISMVCLEMPFCGDLRHAETGQLICSANRLTGFCVVRVLPAKYFRTDHNTTKRFKDGKLPLWNSLKTPLFEPLVRIQRSTFKQ